MRAQVPADVIEAARNGGRAEIERVLEEVWPHAYRLAHAILPHPSSAEDIAQNACVRMYRTIGTLRDARAFPIWFYRIIVREALKQKRSQSQGIALSAEPAYREDPSDSIDLWRALASLPQRLRTVIVLHYFEDLPSREIASILRVPDATVRFRLMTARRRLQPMLREQDESDRAKGEGLYAL